MYKEAQWQLTDNGLAPVSSSHQTARKAPFLVGMSV